MIIILYPINCMNNLIKVFGYSNLNLSLNKKLGRISINILNNNNKIRGRYLNTKEYKFIIASLGLTIFKTIF